MSRSKQLVVVVLGLPLLASAAFTSSSSYAASSDFIVRFRSPQDSKSILDQSLSKSSVRPQSARILNAEEGVVHLDFATREQAEAARARFLRMSDVESVAPNLTYEPAISYKLKDAVENSQQDEEFLGLPLFPSDLSAKILKGLPEVAFPGAPTRGVDPLAGKDWALSNIRMVGANELSASKRIVAAVIDTGVDYNHEDLIGAMWRKPGTPSEVGWDFAHDNAKPFDVVHFDIEGCMRDLACRRLGVDNGRFMVNPGHGTHCAGHVGAVANNGLGIRGVGAGAQVMALKFFYDVGEASAGKGDDAAGIRAIDYAVKNGARVISASWGGRVDRATAHQSELKKALQRARAAGVLVVIAAGNFGIDQDSVDNPAYPAAYGDELDNLIVVAATDVNDELAEFSNYGANSVHIAAPGVKILSTTAGKSKYSDVVARYTDAEGNVKQIDWDGTSMATPIVAGAAALLWSQNPNWKYTQVRDQILRTARPVPALADRVITGGILDVRAMLAK